MELDHPKNVCKFYKNYKKMAGISKLAWWMRGNITIQLWKLAKKNYSEKCIGTNNCDCKNVFTKPGGWASMSMANALAY
jgi:hypothetical protein